MYYYQRMEEVNKTSIHRHLMWYEIFLIGGAITVVMSLFDGIIGVLSSLVGLVLMLMSVFAGARYGNSKKKKSGAAGRVGASFLALVLWLILLGVSANLSTQGDINATPAQSVVQETPATREELLTLVNAERERVGAAPLIIDEKLNQSAQWKADTMLRTGNYGHVDPETGKKDGLEYALSLKTGCPYISENLVWSSDNNITTAKQAVDSWINSPNHYAAMINPEFTRTGFGVTDTIATQHFCKP